jgi:hypothetical protein
MDRPKKYDTSLAFVDVITNGLGGMLVLFFIVALVQSRLEWQDQADSSDRSVRRKSEPFVLILRSKNKERLFNANTADSIWSFEGIPDGVISDRRGVEWDWGADYAVFVAKQPLGLNSRARIRVDTNVTEVIVEVYPSGAQKKTYPVRISSGTTWTEVWPALDSR